ncbi:MAG: helix-turn-helix transcriptional regulator [Treponema sp.]|nr:helix-turn-helix transcriptional regulator [Treponema sp.]
MALQKIFMTNMKKYRKQAGLTQEKLAEACNTDPCYIRQIETGRRCPSFEYVERIANALGIAPHRLFYDEIDAENDEFINLFMEQKQKIKTMLVENISRICLMLDEQQ